MPRKKISAVDASAPGGVFASVIQSYTPLPDEYSVEIGGKSYTFRGLKDASEIAAIARDVQKLWQSISIGKSPDKSWEPYLPSDNQVLNLAVVISRTSVEPKIPLKDLLYLAKEHGAMFVELVERVNVAQQMHEVKSDIAENDAIEELGKV